MQDGSGRHGPADMQAGSYLAASDRSQASPIAQPALGVRAMPRSRAYTRARRHSSRVRLLKLAIPLGAAAAVALVIGVALFEPREDGEGLTLGPIALSGTKITMEHPRLTGYQSDSRPYEVTATAAMQDVRKPTLIELNDLRAKLTLNDEGREARLQAAFGLFDTQKEQLELKQAIQVRTDDGQEVDLASAFIDFKAGTVTSREPVEIRLPGARINANTLLISDGGKVMTLQGRVRTLFTDVAAAGAQPPGADAPSAVPAAQTTSQRP